jgi:hypothetical protein
MGGGGQAGVGGQGGGLPACAIQTRPNDPAGSGIPGTDGTCNTVPLTGPIVTAAPLDVVDGGAAVDGGPVERPTGGSIQDGDYDLIGWRNQAAVGSTMVRAIRVFDGGTYIEWAERYTFMGTTNSYWIDSSGTPQSHTLPVGAACAQSELTSVGYTAAGDTLVLYDFVGNADGVGALKSVDTFHRTCRR